MTIEGKIKQIVGRMKSVFLNVVLTFFLYINKLRQMIKNERSNLLVIISIFCLTAIVMCVCIGPMFYDPMYFAKTEVKEIGISPCSVYLFGTDNLGRDVLARVLVGGRLSLEIAIIASFVTVIIGTFYGMISGFWGGWIDGVMMRIVDGLYAVPFIFFAILLVTLFGRKFYLIFIAIACVSWLDIAKIVRGQVMSIKKKEFIDAERIVGLSNFQIVCKHILPNLVGLIIVYATLTIPNILSLTAFLGFIGLGVQPPMTGWGEMISEGSQCIVRGYWWVLAFPCLFLSLTLLSLNFISNAIRNKFDHKS